MATRCKMRLTHVIPMAHGPVTAYFTCQYDTKISAEDAAFSKYTPSGKAEYIIDNPLVISQLVIGQDYYFDIEAVPAPVPEEQAAS